MRATGVGFLPDMPAIDRLTVTLLGNPTGAHLRWGRRAAGCARRACPAAAAARPPPRFYGTGSPPPPAACSTMQGGETADDRLKAGARLGKLNLGLLLRCAFDEAGNSEKAVGNRRKGGQGGIDKPWEVGAQLVAQVCKVCLRQQGPQRRAGIPQGPPNRVHKVALVTHLGDA